MSGYAARKGMSEGVHDSLYARIVALEHNGNRVVFISTDLIGFYGGTYDFMVEGITHELGLQKEALFLTGIHTHSGPAVTIDQERGHPNNIAYTKDLRGKLINGLRKALSDMREATIGAGRGYSAVGMNRREDTPEGTVKIGRNPYGVHDKEVLVARVDHLDGSPVAALFDYATHSTALGPDNLSISGDVLGLASHFAEKIIGGGLIAPAFAGASGDIDPWYRVLPHFNVEPGWIAEPVLLGTLLGVEVVRTYRGITERVSKVEVRSAFSTIKVPAKRDGSSGNDEVAVPVNLIAARIGNTGFVGINAEVLTEVGSAIKKDSPFPSTFVITHCNGATGYLPPAHLYKEGGYEIKSSPFAPGAAEIVVQQALRLLYSL